MQHLDALAHRLTLYTSGPRGLVVGYFLVGVFVFAGLLRARARLGLFVLWPIVTVPVTIAAAIASSVALWAIEQVTHIHLAEIDEVGISLIVFMVVGFWGGRYVVARDGASGPMFNRGAWVSEEGARAPRRRRGVPDRLALAGVAVAGEDEVKHFKLIGATGTGKSTAMRELLHGALARGDRAVIADPDGGYLSRFYDPGRGDVILNPFDARSAKWDIFAELTSAYDVEQLARSLMPDQHGDSQWTAFARTFFEAVTRQAASAGVQDIGELYRLLTSAPPDEIRLIVAGTAAAPFAEEGNAKMFLGLRSTASEHVKSFDYIRAQQGRAFSVREWVRNGRGVLFLPYQAEQIAAVRSVISCWMRLAIYQTMSLGETDNRLWFAVDELDALGAIDGLAGALPRLRKFGGRCVLGFQSIAQVSTTYDQGPAQAMVENCGNTLILRCSASEHGGTARFASQLIGEREVVRVTHSRSRHDVGLFTAGKESVSRSEQHAMEYAVLPAEIEQLADRTGYLKVVSHPGWMKIEFPVYDLPQGAEPFVPLAKTVTPA